MLNRLREEQPILERDRLSILLAVTLMGATLFRFVELPTFAWSVRRILGSPLGFKIGGDWLLAALMMGLVATGMYALMQTHPKTAVRERSVGFSLITPTLGALFASLLLMRATAWTAWLGALLLMGVLLGVLVHCSYRVILLKRAGYASMRMFLNVANYLLGFALFGMVLAAQERALVTGPAILLLSGCLSLDLLSASGAELREVALYSGLLALLEGELAWVLSYWPISPWASATVLTLGLYVGSGLGYQYLLDKLNRRIFVEFAILAVIVFGVILLLRP